MAAVMAQHAGGLVGMQAPAPLLQPQLMPQAQLPPAAVRLDAYRKVFAIFMAGSYDLVSMVAGRPPAGSPAVSRARLAAWRAQCACLPPWPQSLPTRDASGRAESAEGWWAAAALDLAPSLSDRPPRPTRCRASALPLQAKEDALASLRLGLVISDREHESVKAAAMAEAQHHLQLHPLPSHAGGGGGGGGSQELSAAHSSGAAGSRGGGAAPPRRATPASGAKAAAAPRKRARVSDGGAGAAGGGPAAARGGSRAGARAQAAGPTSPAPRAAPGVVLDPLVGHVVMRHWPNDGGW